LAKSLDCFELSPLSCFTYHANIMSQQPITDVVSEQILCQILERTSKSKESWLFTLSVLRAFRLSFLISFSFLLFLFLLLVSDQDLKTLHFLFQNTLSKALDIVDSDWVTAYVSTSKRVYFEVLFSFFLFCSFINNLAGVASLLRSKVHQVFLTLVGRITVLALSLPKMFSKATLSSYVLQCCLPFSSDLFLF
jgi:hypothetical protein